MSSKLFVRDYKQLLILYATQTGTTERFAQTLYSSAKARNFLPALSKMDDYDFANKLVHDKNVLFLLSTFYNGEFPDNGLKFWNFLQSKQHPKNFLSKTNYSVFGLGNSSFKDTFTRSARLLDARLFELGAKRIIEPGFGNEFDPNGHESGYKPWTKRLWEAMGATNVTHLPSSYEIKDMKKKFFFFPSEKVTETYLPKDFLELKIIKNELLTPKDYSKPANLLTLDISGTGVMLKPGDKIQVQPNNNPNIVERCARIFKLTDLDKPITLNLVDQAIKTVLPKATTQRILLTSFLDIQSIPLRSFLEELSLVTSDKLEKTNLENLAGNLLSGNEYTRRCQTDSFSIVDVLEEFKSVKLTFDQFISICPTIFPRYYSICSSQLKNPNQLQIVFAQEKRIDNKGKVFEGLASAYMMKLKPNDSLCISIPRATEKLDVDESKPALLVGLGTGLGVVRGILQQRNELKKEGKPVGKAVLFAGVRHENKDFLFKEEFKELEKQGLVDVIPAFSMDQKKFITVIDKMEEHPKIVYETLKNGGHYIYCGLGGLIPGHVEQGVIRTIKQGSGISKVAASNAIKNLKDNKRWIVEAFSTSIDDENAFKNLKIKTGGKSQSLDLSIYDQFAESAKMFCYQCEQTNQGKGCTQIGVCGKTPEVASLQDLLVEYTKRMSWFAYHLKKFSINTQDADRFSLTALFSTLTNVNFDPKKLVTFINHVRKLTKGLEKEYYDYCVHQGIKPEEGPPKEDAELAMNKGDFDINDEQVMKKLIKKGEDFGILKRYFAVGNDSVVGLQEMLVYGLKGITAYADHCLMLNKENPAIYSFIHEALTFLTSSASEDLGKVLEMLMKCGQANYETMKLLHEANTTYGAQTPHKVSATPVEGKCILVSGHDLKMLHELLKQTESQGINIYTHGEMLPAHGYEGLRKFPNLKGHIGAAWQKQSIEFPKFPGPIILTTNCLTPPKAEYIDQIYTMGAVGFPGVPHIDEKRMDYSSVIEKAKSMPGFTKDTVNNFSEYKDLVVGFAHEAVLSVADTIIKAVKSGEISRFYLIGGCDGYEAERNYFTEFARILPKTSVVMSCGCGKYKVNQLEYGTIGNTGIPRFLDLGQCNDSFSAIQIALALKDAFGAKSVNDLPLSIILSWFEQKAIAVLLTLLSLGIKNIHIGPAGPGFLTPQVMKVLSDKFQMRLVSDPKEDLNRILLH